MPISKGKFSTQAVVHRITVFPLAIPLRHKVSHAAAERSVTDTVVVGVELSNGIVGYGETVPRSYVTQETVGSVVSAIAEVFMPFLLDFHPRSFPEALEAIESLPWCDASERLVPAARAGVELGLLDATLRIFGRSCDDVVGWMGIAGFGSPGSAGRVRFGGVLAAEKLEQTMRQLRLMYWYGLRDFKLKVGMPGDLDKLALVSRYLGRSMQKGRATLRIDANGAWSKDQAIEWLTDADESVLTLVEQPLPRGAEDQLPVLRDLFDISLMHDESLITVADARQLIKLGVADAFNIRISKCGGLLPALRLAALARRSHVRIQLGCMVGETSILSAVGLRFLQVCPGVEWAEGCYGSRLLETDVCAKGLRFGYGGRPPQLRGSGFGVDVDPDRLRRLCVDGPVVLNL